MYHDTKSPLAGKTVKLKNGTKFRVEDYYDRCFIGHSINREHGSAVANTYAARRDAHKLPADDEVLYGKVGIISGVIHVSEIATGDEPVAAE